MHRFYLPPEQTHGDVFVLTDREAHHGAQVLRLQTGDMIEVVNGVGTRFRCEVKRATRRQIEAAVNERQTSISPQFEITLCQAIVKGKTMETIIQKATELGVSRIVPIETERVVSQFDSASAQSKQGKWQQVAIEAIKQCGSAYLPLIDAPVTPQVFLKRGEKLELGLVGSLEGDGRHPRHWFQSLRAIPRRAVIWIGPEGDFTSAELDLIRSSGAHPITLGELVLRADTAAIYSLAVVRHELEWLIATGSKP